MQVITSPEHTLPVLFSLDYHHTHTLRFNGHFPGEPGLADCLFNSPSPFIPGLRILLGQT